MPAVIDAIRSCVFITPYRVEMNAEGKYEALAVIQIADAEGQVLKLGDAKGAVVRILELPYGFAEAES